MAQKSQQVCPEETKGVVVFSCSVVSDALQPPWAAAHQASLSIINSRSLLKLMYIELVMPSNQTISSSVIPFSSCPQSFPARGEKGQQISLSLFQYLSEALASVGFDPWVGKIPWRRAWQLTPVFLPGESHGQRSLAGYSSRGHKESDMTEAT